MRKIRKALAAAIAAGLAAVADGIVTGGLGKVNIAIVVGAMVAAGLAVWRIPNAPKS